MTTTFRKKIFERILSTRLIYNQCWEDYALDQSALQIGTGDRIVTITSAGCNALNYLLFNPEQIDAIDLNPHQTALLELKIAAIRSLPHSKFFAMFGEGKIERHRETYAQWLRPFLSKQSRRIWDRHIDYFDLLGSGLYFNGLAGTFARSMNLYVKCRPGMREDLDQFLNLDNIRLQAEFYRSKIAPRLWSHYVRWMLNRKTTMMMLGVPEEQIRQMSDSGIGDLSSFVEQRLEHMFTQVPIRTNYFWHVYMKGSYSQVCCPPYLRPQNFGLLRERVERIRTHTMNFSDFLRSSSNRFSIYVLLDHMDWLRGNAAALNEEWTQILKSALPGARIIFRSGALSFDVPDFAQDRLTFHSELARSLHQHDRIGTYGSFYFATLGAS
jgi:S-adenosylmethionine-diacylglycerol 3-amino-3-carboxypropyl transferase